MDKLKASGLKPKDLVGIPWRVAFALQADGWYLRSDIIWAKPTDIWTNLANGMSWRTCHNGAKDHEEARRGAKTGTQGLKGAIERGRVPQRFCEEIIIACEKAVGRE